jgi:putative YhbY family RNA-binding protein
MIPLEPEQRRALRALAHHLEPVVTIGHAGLSPAVLHEIDVSLFAHELIKIRVQSADRDAREELLHEVCDRLDAAPVQHIGKLLVVFRPRPEEQEREEARSPSRSRRSGTADPAGSPGRSGTSARGATPGRSAARARGGATPPRVPAPRGRRRAVPSGQT